MGVVAHSRQTFLDAGWLKRQWAAYESRGKTGKRTPSDPCLEALWPALDGKLPVAFEADTADQINRALDFAAEFGLKPIIVGGRYAWKVADRLKAAGVPVILRLDFSAAGEREAGLPARVRDDRERLRKEEAGCAAALHKAGIKFAFMSHGLVGAQATTTFRDNLRKTIDAGLSTEAALAALTRDAAEILGVSSQVGRISKGRTAHLIVCEGDFHARQTKYRYAFSDGVYFDLSLATPTSTEGGGGTGRFGRKNRKDGPDPKTPANPPAVAKQPDANTGRPNGPGGGAGPARAATPPFNGNALRMMLPALDAVEALATETETDRTPKIKTGVDALIRVATVLTGAGKVLPKTDILIHAGKICAIGQDLPLEKGVTVIEAEGMFVMPGIIDSHSHFAISGGVNEGSLSVVPEVRVRDVIDSEDAQLFRALGGGVTTARLLHGKQPPSSAAKTPS